MARSKIIVIAQNQPLNNDSHLKRKFINAEHRAQRQASRFSGMDLYAIQKQVHKNIKEMLLFLDGGYLDLLDLLNYVKNDCHVPHLTPENHIQQHYSLTDVVTLNGIYLYQYLLRNGFDPVIVQNYATADIEELLEERPLAVCISSNFIFMDDIKQIASYIKKVCPRTFVIAGGMLVKKVLDAGDRLSKQALSFLSSFQGCVDAFVVESQGEQALIRLLNSLKRGEDIATIPNLALFDKDANMAFTQREPEYMSMDETAVQWDAIPRQYLRNSLPINSSRGCAFRCRFCTYHWLLPKVEYKTLDVLRDELRSMQRLGFVRHVRFTDDNFTANKERLKAVLRMMIQEGFDFTWSSFVRADALTPELADLMKESGCEFVDMGLESGSQVILDNMDKRLQKHQAIEGIRILNDFGIWGRGSFIIGYPGETEDTFLETCDFINESGLPFYHPYLFYYSPNTRVHLQGDKFGIKGLGLSWRHSTMDSAKASYLMSQMVYRIDRCFTDGQAYVEEIYKLLRAKGFAPEEVFKLFRLKRELLLAAGQDGSEKPFSSRMEEIILDIRGLVNRPI